MTTGSVWFESTFASRFRRVALMGCLAVIPGVGASAQLSPSMDELAGEAGAVVTRDAKGDLESVVLRRNGVVISSNRINTTGQDQSGHGAVLCSWSIYIELRAILDACFPDQYAEAHKRFDGAISGINEFIVANSLMPTTRAALDAMIVTREATIRRQMLAVDPDARAKRCEANEAHDMIAKISLMPQNGWRREVADLLSVPRPPVMNPCL